MNTAIHFTNDLRTFDNKAVTAALALGRPTVAFSIRHKANSARQNQFLAESLGDLADELQQLRVPLLIFDAADIESLQNFITDHKITSIYAAHAFNSRKRHAQKNLESHLEGLRFHYSNSETLLDLALYSLSASEIDDNFTHFRKNVEARWVVAAMSLPPKPLVTAISIKAPFSRFVREAQVTPAGAKPFTGGRAAGLKRLNHYLFESRRVLRYKETRNGLIDFDDSSKFSPWLAHGCLSAKEIYWALKDFEQKAQANESTYWLVFELLWRDYFKFLAEKHQTKFFERQGLLPDSDIIDDDKDDASFEMWKLGKTPNDFINAHMIELAKTSWMSNRGRQNVANYLAKTLKVDWRKGAEWFESNLIDYDCENNWGNWLYQSGAGSDPRNRVFNPDLQAQHYDPDAAYRRKWLQKGLGDGN